MARKECIQLGMTDVDAERGTVLIREGKGRKDRVLPIGERAPAVIEKYLDDLRPSCLVAAREPALFLAEHGEPLTRSYLSRCVGS